MTTQPVSAHLGAPYSTLREDSTRIMLLGSGELGKEIALEAMRLGAYVIAVDSYEHAPAHHVAHESHVIDMSHEEILSALIREVQPDIIVPEVEAIATSALTAAQRDQHIQVVPSVSIAQICMNREALRVTAAEKCGVPTTPYRFAQSEEELLDGALEVGFPCVIKPILSSSGHGQSVAHSPEDIPASWRHAQEDRRTAGDGTVSRVIVEAFAPLDYELTILTVSSSAGVVTCPPVGHVQKDGDYQESWQPASVEQSTLEEAQRVARAVVEQLVADAQAVGEKGWGVFGVEIFVLTDGRVLFNEVSPRPHDTGMVTMISQNLSEFALHARAILGIPVHANDVTLRDASRTYASRAVVVDGEGEVIFSNLPEALSTPGTDLRLFGKPEVHGHRRMAVLLASAASADEAREGTAHMLETLHIQVR
ncbi:phosphoribosylglycinamide formyltransferase 2 [Alloscardovia macacae]|uniref:Formate-dependent phosphoribosylglycinamide formyltransferase n=1 Tax=Alloscardovia macacae TaxID=1160091 RepID=A0A1Y2T2L4_9BIFI|nr:formate-dependent phosphoribosylglycinamide formyltransferase [Alloscardovia macacae]OTA26929.1 phosphoribosylglycinamide formyltransferase 2 [Alloscardovia macacae]OTA30082.1 phosphoribosylglycinamide formyltransferase 2 [Alloscardovia macacae]